MDNKTSIPKNLEKDCQRIGYASLNTWFNENEIKLQKSDNWMESLSASIIAGTLTINQLESAVAELDDNSDKKIFLMKATNFEVFADKKKDFLKDLHKRKGIVPTDKKYTNGQPAAAGNPTFISLFWDENILKIKYSEIQYVVEPDYENSKFVRTEKRVNVIYIIDVIDGFVQLRLDSAGTIHRHKGESGKSTDSAYENFYKELLKELFPEVSFADINLNGVANHISNNEKKVFRINKGVTTITNNAKQTFATASIQADVRNLPEYEAAASNGTDMWLTEDLTGYWVASESNGDLKKDLFMRISRRYSQIRVQRGCLEKELNYGITKIRSIQGTV